VVKLLVVVAMPTLHSGTMLLSLLLSPLLGLISFNSKCSSPFPLLHTERCLTKVILKRLPFNISGNIPPAMVLSTNRPLLTIVRLRSDLT
jgi:hypothetical protein